MKWFRIIKAKFGLWILNRKLKRLDYKLKILDNVSNNISASSELQSKITTNIITKLYNMATAIAINRTQVIVEKCKLRLLLAQLGETSNGK